MANEPNQKSPNYRETRVSEGGGSGGGNKMLRYLAIALAVIVAIAIVLWLLGVFSGSEDSAALADRTIVAAGALAAWGAA